MSEKIQTNSEWHATKIELSLPTALYEQVRSICEKRGVTLEETISSLIDRYMPLDDKSAYELEAIQKGFLEKTKMRTSLHKIASRGQERRA